MKRILWACGGLLLLRLVYLAGEGATWRKWEDSSAWEYELRR